MYCPSCRAEYPDDWKRCPKDEAELLRSQYIGKYRVDAVIGTGGMGAVYRAFNPDTQSPVAIKLMHPEASSSEASRARFQREAASVAALQTRHLVNIYDFGCEGDGTLYLVMEYLVGHNLRVEIQDPERIPIPRVHMILDGALRGLGAAHKKGIIHRDLKPENVFIASTDDGEVAKILDFGIAHVDTKDQSVLTKEGALLGTPAYMAPEQVAGNRGQMGPWTDVYAMGVILYEMLAGSSPFADQSVTAVLTRVLTRDFQPLGRVRPELPQPVLALVDRAMSDAPDSRFADANGFREAWVAAYKQFDPMIQSATVPVFRRAAQAAPAAPAPAPSLDPMSATEYPSDEELGRAATYHTPGQPNRPGPAPLPVPVPAAPTHAPTPAPAPAAPRGRGRLAIALVLVAAAAAVGVVLALRGGGSASAPGPVDAGARAALPADAGVAAPPAPPDAARPAHPELVALPGGAFELGSMDDSTRTPVTVAPFQLDRTEMSRAGYRAAITAAGRLDDLGAPLAGDDADELPVRNVTLAEAEAACAALGKRLPSEAEWEFAAAQVVLDAARARLHHKGVTGPGPVGAHPGDCSPAGICDLLGNVSEWTASPAAGEPGRQVVRGGSYSVSPKSRYASAQSRSVVASGSRDPELGFRCARDATP